MESTNLYQETIKMGVHDKHHSLVLKFQWGSLKLVHDDLSHF